MSTDPLQPQLAMALGDLSHLPAPTVPPGYALRHFEPGDEAAWVGLVDEAFGGPAHAPEWMYERLDDWDFDPARVWFVVHGAQPVATAIAWYRPRWGQTAGYLHMVAGAEVHRGRGLGAAVSAAALTHMRRDGRDRAVLETDDFRIPAVRAYLTLGFIPRLIHDNQRARWRTVLAACRRDPEAYAAWLDGPLDPPAD